MSQRTLARLACAALVAVVVTALGIDALIENVGGASRREPHELATLSSDARALVDAAFADLGGAPVVDHHVHLAGLGTGGSGCEISPTLRSWAHPIKRAQLAIYWHAARIEDESAADEQYVARLADLAIGIPHPVRLGLLGFDRRYDENGALDRDRSEIYVPNTWSESIASRDPSHFFPIASVHPMRSDALMELERLARAGVRMIKWLPNAQGIDPMNPRFDLFYQQMQRSGLALLTHAGSEAAVEGHDQELGNPLRLRRPLELGVTVVVAHCASLGRAKDLDDPSGAEAECFDLFLRMMGEERWNGRLFGEISTLTQSNRCERPLATLLERTDLHARLVHGSDYPLPAIHALYRTSQLVSLGYLTKRERELLNEVYDVNPLLFDLVLKRTVKHPTSGARFGPSVFLGKRELGT